MPEETPKIWLRQKSERNKDYALFKEFLMLPAHLRDVEHLQQALPQPVKPYTIKRLMASFRWEARAAAYDDFRDRQLEVETEERYRKARVDAMDRAERVGGLLDRQIQFMADKDPSKINPRELAAVARACKDHSGTQRTAHDKPETITEERHTGQVAQNVLLIAPGLQSAAALRQPTLTIQAEVKELPEGESEE